MDDGVIWAGSPNTKMRKPGMTNITTFNHALILQQAQGAALFEHQIHATKAAHIAAHIAATETHHIQQELKSQLDVLARELSRERENIHAHAHSRHVWVPTIDEDSVGDLTEPDFDPSDMKALFKAALITVIAEAREEMQASILLRDSNPPLPGL
jgi:hypothetical protein